MATQATVTKFPVKPRKKDRPVLSSIVDLRGQMARMMSGTASNSSQARNRSNGVTLPPMSFYGDERCYYKDGCLYVGNEVIRRRKI
jgi:hypothetical protein